MSTLYIRLPARATIAHAQYAAGFGCAFALAADNGSVQREGVALLSELADLVAGAQRVRLLLAAADVSLLRVVVPPLSPARLRVALPNLVEDQLIGELSESVVAAGRTVDGLRTVAVVQREWLEMLAKTLIALGARKLSALPAQLCLPYRAAAVSAAVTGIEAGDDIGLTLRLAEQEGLGLPVLPEAGRSVAAQALQTLQLVAPAAAVTLYVPAAEVRAYQELLQADTEQRITIQPDRWAHWIAGAQEAEPDLLAGLGGGTGPSFNWSRWRWPLILASAVLLVNVAALNLDWWRLRQDANAAHTALTRTFQAAYPKETVIVDPALQMRQKIAAARQAAGQPAADDFTALAAAFAEAWKQAASAGRPLPALAALEYHERTLLVRLTTPDQIPLARLQTALAARNLALSQQDAGVLRIRSAP